MKTTATGVAVLPAAQICNVVSAGGYGEQFAAFDPATATVYWAASGDLVGQSAPTLGDDGALKRDLIELTRSPRPLAVWFPAGAPRGWDAAIADQ